MVTVALRDGPRLSWSTAALCATVSRRDGPREPAGTNYREVHYSTTHGRREVWRMCRISTRFSRVR
jgi:hypothetical protein